MEKQEFIIELLKITGNADMCSDLMWSTDKDGELTFALNCSDVFFWGCADAEDITPDRLDILKKCIDDLKKATNDNYPSYISELFASRIRKMRPQGAAYPRDNKVWALFDKCGPERKVGLGNPKDHPSKNVKQ